jgi:class 3 adenylate cyclase/tetratricopeptide (TPR) repeat protein/DNA-binding winged helix-turn-helix (wHTH) protein
VEFRVLGPLEILDDSGGVVHLRAAKERTLLLGLLLHANEVVSSGSLIDYIWGEQRPESAANVIQTYVSHLRLLLQPGRPRTSNGVILRRTPGYLLRVEPGQLDRHRFDALVAEARSHDDPKRAVELLREALGLWRGPALQEFAFEDFARTEIARLEDLRLSVVGERVELELRLGRHADLVGELEALVTAHPLREQLRGQLMRALYGSGRQAEALQVGKDARRLLVEELGIEPSLPLQEFARAILRQDAVLEPEAFVVAPAQALRVPPAEPQPTVKPARVAEVRKTVTIVFSDLVDSSRLSLQLDPEAHRNLLGRYFDEMREVVERHGGMVEKYIGDAVMAVFGIPVLHEDDALRAVRAAFEMREVLAALNDDLERNWGVRLAARIGVNTGEVIAGDHSQGHLFVTGKPVNVAKRLEEAAETSEILIGEATHRLVRDAVLIERGGKRTVKHGEAIDVLGLLAVFEHAPGHLRRFDAPFVGRERHRAALQSVFGNAVSDRACHLLTVLGDAGVGKSRLVQEFVEALGNEVTVLRGRCLPYGEGITYWPLAEVVKDVTRAEGQDPGEQSVAIAARLVGEEKAELIAERIAAALGLGGTGGGTTEETFWAVRKLFEALSRPGPLVVVFDDIHWAQPTFLDLVEHVAVFSRDFPILLVCIARPELLDTRPDWGGGKLNAISILLEPLSESECRQLISNLLGGAPLPPDAESRIAEATEGNALFAEEMVAMLVDDQLLTRDNDHWVASSDLSDLPVPSTVQALLAARVEGLPADEWAIVTAASVEGTVFHRGAVSELAPDSFAPTLERNLMALVRRHVIRPDFANFAGEEAYRFRHALIRDAAYRSLSKSTRADLHERFAGWLERMARERLREFEEIVGYHLEQAYSCRAAIGSIDTHAATLATRSAQRLGSAGRRALARSDLPAAIRLLERASDLLALDAPRRAALLPELGAALIEAGRLSDAEAVLAEARRLAASAEDECADSHAVVQQEFLQLLRVASGGTEEAAQTVESVIPVFERCGDDHGLCRAWRLQAWLHWNAGRAEGAAEAWERAAAHARRAGDEEERREILNWVASSLFFGPTPVPEGIRRCDEIRDEVSGNLGAEAWTLRSLAGLHAMDGRFELARNLLADSNAIFHELGQTLNSSVSHVDGIVEMLAGDPAAAERHLLEGYRALEEMGDKAFLSSTAAYLAQAVYAQGRYEEASRYTEISEALASRDDLLTQVIWRSARAGFLARQGHLEQAEALARKAVNVAESTDFVTTRADALTELAAILKQGGRVEEARSAAADGLALYEQKGNSVAAGKIRTDLAVLFQV